MKSLISLLFVLDFSGSMEQKILEKSKQEVLRTRLESLASSLQEDQKIQSISFGSGNYQACGKVEKNTFRVGELSDWLKSQRPGSFAKTPLALAIEEAMGQITKDSIPNIVVITDGHDTCGKDPCESIRKLGKKLKGFGKNLNIDVVGYDIKNKDQHLNCFMGDIANVNFRYFEADSDMQFRERLQTIDESFKKRKLLNEAKDRLAELENLSPEQRLDRNFDQDGQKTKNSLRQIGKALLKIQGAPDNVSFVAYKGATRLRKWEGEFSVELASGEVRIQLVSNDSKKMDLKLEAGTDNVISYKDLIGVNTGQLEIKNTLFPLLLEPIKVAPKVTKKTELDLFFGKPEEKKNTDFRQPISFAKDETKSVDAGKWILKIVSPWWLSGPLDLEIEIFAGQKRSLDMKQIYKTKLSWVQNPEPSKRQVVILNGIYGGDIRILIQKELKQIPIPEQWSAYWVEEKK